MGDMLKSLKQFVEIAKGDESRLNWFADQFSAIITRRLENEGNTLTSRLGVLHEALDIFSNVRPTLPNNFNVEKLTKLLFVDCVRIILSEGYIALEKAGTSVQLNNFKSVINKAVNRLRHTGYSHRFDLLQFVLKYHWSHPVLQQIMLNMPCDHEVAMAYIERGETTEMFHIRVQLLLQSGYHDLALNLCNWCVKSRKYWYDSYLRAVQLHVLQSKGDLDLFTKQCQQLTCCMGLEIARKMKIDSELYLSLLQTILVQDWLRPVKHCCTKELLDLWLEARYQVEETEQGFLNSVSGLVHRHCSTWQLMSLVDVMHSKFGKHFMQFYLEVCLKVLRKDRSYLEEARALRKQKVIESQRGSLTYVCTVINCVSGNWSWKLRRLAMLSAMSLEPSEEFVDIIESLYQTNEERHDCHLVENIDNAQADVRGRSHRRKKLTKFELRAATMCSKDGYVFIPESSDMKHHGMNKTIRRRMLNGENTETREPGTSVAPSDEFNNNSQNGQHAVIKEEPSGNPDCVCHINDKCPCGKAPIASAAVLNGLIDNKVNQNFQFTATQSTPAGGGVNTKELLDKYFVVRDVLPKTSQDLIDLLTELRCPDLNPAQPYEDLYHKCEAHLHPPPHSCIYEVFDGGMSPVGSDAEDNVELFEIRPGATKWIFDGEDLDAPEPKMGRGRPRKIVVLENAEHSNPSTDNEEITEVKKETKRRRGRPRKKVIYEEIEDRTSDSDTDRADSQYSGSTVVNSPMSVSTETDDFEIHINEDVDMTDSQDIEALQGMVNEIPKVQKDSVKREAMFKNFDRIRDKMKKGKLATDAVKDSTDQSQRNLPHSLPDQSQRSKAIMSEYMKEQRRLENRTKDTAPSHEYQPAYNVKGFHDYSLAQKRSRPEKSGAVKTPQTENSTKLTFSTWDASLRQDASASSVEMLKDYRIPKKPSELSHTTSVQNTTNLQSRNSMHTVSHPGGALHISYPGHNRPTTHNNQQLQSVSGLKTSPPNTSHTTLSMGKNIQSHHPTQRNPSSYGNLSAVQQLASRPAHKSLVSSVTVNTTNHPLSGVTGIRPLRPTVPQTHISPPQPQQKPFTHSTQAATYHQSQPRNLSMQQGLQVSHATAVNQHTHRSWQMQQTSRSQNSLINSINQRLPSNVTVHSVQTQSKPPGTPPTAGKATVVPLLSAQVKVARSSVAQEASKHPIVYLDNFVADPKKPWPCLSAPEVMSQLDSHTRPVGQEQQNINTPQSKVQISRSNQQFQSSKIPQQTSSIVHKGPHIVQYNHDKSNYHKVQHITHQTPKEVDSDVEIYSTHKSPVVPAKGAHRPKDNQQEVVVVPQIKERDIEVKQLNILSNLRKKIGIGDAEKCNTVPSKMKSKSDLEKCSTDPNQIKSESTCTDNSKTSGFGNLSSQIGQVIENVIRSDQFRQKDKKNHSTSSSHSQKEKGHTAGEEQTSVFTDVIAKAGNCAERISDCDISGVKSGSACSTPEPTKVQEDEMSAKQGADPNITVQKASDIPTENRLDLVDSQKDIPASMKFGDDADSDDSCDSLPRDGSFKMMALSPKSSSVKVLEGTNVHDLLESLQDSSGTVPQEVVRAAHLKLNKDESIEDVLLKMEHMGSASSTDTPCKATPGTKRTEKVAWGCSFKQGVYSVEVSKDRARKQKFRTKKISKEELENEPISEMANKEGVKVFVIQVKKSSRSGSGRSTPALGSPVPEEETQDIQQVTKESVPVPIADNDIITKSIKAQSVQMEQASEGKEAIKTKLGVGAIESSLHTSASSSFSGNKKQTVSVAKGSKSGEIHGEQNRPNLTIKSNISSNGKEQSCKGASTSSEQMVTVRPQFGGRLIPELSPLSQRVKVANFGLAGPTSGTVRAVFTVAGPASSPHLIPNDKVIALNAEHLSTESKAGDKSAVSVAMSSTGPKPVVAHVYGRDAPSIKVSWPSSSSGNTAKLGDSSDVKVVEPISSVVSSSATSCTTTSTVVSQPEANPIPTSLSNLPADARVTKVIMHPNNANIAKVLEVPVGVLDRTASPITNDSSQASSSRGVLISHTVAEWCDVVSYMAKHNNYSCRICGKKYGTEKMMGLHVSRTHSQVLHVEGGFLCPLCEEDDGEKFPTFEDIKIHMEGKHRRDIKQESSRPESKPSVTERQQKESSSKASEIPDRSETPTSENSSTPAKLKPVDTSSDEEISFKITAEERERVLGPEEWPPSPVVNTEEQSEQGEKQEKQVAKRGRPRKSKVTSNESSTSKRVGRRKTSNSPDERPQTKSRKENEENTPQTTRRNSRSPPRPAKRKASPSPTGSTGRPARKNTLNQRLQQRRVSEETGAVQGKHGKRGGSSEKVLRDSSKDSTDSRDSPAKSSQIQKAISSEQNSEHKADHKNVSIEMYDEDVEIIEENSAGSNDPNVDINESEHVSVIKRNRSPETYQKFFKLTDWGKHAEEQKREWDQVINNATELSEQIKMEPLEYIESSEGNGDCTGAQGMNCVTTGQEENKTGESQRSRQKQSRKSPSRHTGGSPIKKPGSPRSSLWSGNVKPGARDWSKVKQYSRRSKAPEKLCSIKRSRSEDDETPGERQKRRKNDKKKLEEPALKSEVDCSVPSVGNKSEKIDTEPQRVKNNSLTVQSPDIPRTSPCAVSIERLNIRSVHETTFNVSSAESATTNHDVSSKRDRSPGGKQVFVGTDSQAVLRELATVTNQAPAGIERGHSADFKSENETLVNSVASRTSSSASIPIEFVTMESLQSEDERKLTSPPRVTRSRERSESRGSSVSSASHKDSPAKDIGKNKEPSASQSILKSKPKPVMIGDEVIGQPLGGQKQNSDADSSQPRRSSRPSTSQYSVNPKSRDESREERRSRKR